MATRKLAVVMDPITQINTKKDTSFAMMLEAQRRGYELHYVQLKHLSIDQGQPLALSQTVSVTDSPDNYYHVISEQNIHLGDMDVILMR
jgi:glutathione synthase